MKEAIAYTDGACSGNPGVGGWAYVMIYKDEGESNKLRVIEDSRGKAETTNNEMELTAVYMALVKAYKMGIQKVTVYCDSAYVVNAIKKDWIETWLRNGWKTKQDSEVKNRNIWEKIARLRFEKGMLIHMEKVKGHNGNMLNEYVDDLAVAAREYM